MKITALVLAVAMANTGVAGTSWNVQSPEVQYCQNYASLAASIFRGKMSGMTYETAYEFAASGADRGWSPSLIRLVSGLITNIYMVEYHDVQEVKAQKYLSCIQAVAPGQPT